MNVLLPGVKWHMPENSSTSKNKLPIGEKKLARGASQNFPLKRNHQHPRRCAQLAFKKRKGGIIESIESGGSMGSIENRESIGGRIFSLAC
ncbi:hypothetical protein POVCU2_0050250 [Plasmodium ovale curtisi]|uniref:Uncharacterized protein n=1 Tax=Plasmodium ovale curtisi TaxID=864141 RepID=A0A1A8WAK5_PLAOA|nr:hypothetical protein POVCU2_0050250 [Plasmodium ovale curtisi]